MAFGVHGDLSEHKLVPGQLVLFLRRGRLNLSDLQLVG